MKKELESGRHLQGQEVVVVPPDTVAVETGLPKGCDVALVVGCLYALLSLSVHGDS